MKTLFSITADLLALNDLMEDACDGVGEVTDTNVDEAMTKWFNELIDDEGKKLDGYCALISQLEMEVKAAKQKQHEWEDKAKTRERRVAWLTDRMRKHLLLTGRQEAKTASGIQIKVTNNGGGVPLVLEPVDVETLDPKYVRVAKEIDKTEVAKALAAGVYLPWASFATRGTHLRIK
jgi:hypothetical protein